MALKPSQIELITALVKSGGLSNRAIAEKAGCSEAAVRKWIEKTGSKKNALRDLAKDEVSNIINAQKISTQKNALSTLEKTHYFSILLEEAQAQNLYMNVNHAILGKVMASLEDGTKDIKVSVGDGMQHIEPMRHDSNDILNLAKAAQVATDSLGITNRHAPKSDVNVDARTAVANQIVVEIE